MHTYTHLTNFQIIECRRVLSWTYTYGYYALDEMDQKAAVSKSNTSVDENHRFFFEFLQVLVLCVLTTCVRVCQRDHRATFLLCSFLCTTLFSTL
jgi:hypothetical protein